ncbi:MAG: oligosaccharide flippase family protein [Flavobacteriales bacterium]
MLVNKFLEIKKSAFFHDILHSFFSKGLSLGLGFLVTILITRNFSVEVFGEYSFLISIAMTCFQFAHLGFSSANTYYIVHNKKLLSFLLANTQILGLVVGFITLIVLLILNMIYFHREISLIIVTAFMVPFLVITELNRGLLIGLERIKIANNLDLLSKILYTIMIISVIVYFQSIWSLIFAYVMQMFIYSSTSFYNLFKKAKNKLKPSIHLFKKTSNYSIRIYLTLFLAFLVLKIDIYFIEYFMGNKPLGIYSLAATLATHLILIINVVIPLLLPKLATINNTSERIKKLRNIIFYALILLVLINLGFYLIGKWFIVLVFGDKYLESVVIIQILLMATSVLSLETILAQYYAFIGKIKFLIYYWVITLLLNIILNYLWIPKYGIEGAAWASFISYSLILILVGLRLIFERKSIK